jgi:glycosyltransferase involved in cell wall biosynthesis
MNYLIRDKKCAHRIVQFHGEDIYFDNFEAWVKPEVAYQISRLRYGDFAIQDKFNNIPYSKDSWTDTYKKLIWSCNYASANGYGTVAENTARWLLAKGVDVLNPGNISGNPIGGGNLVHKSVYESINKPIFPDCIEIQHCQPPAIIKGLVQRIWTYTMFETTHTPQKWIDKLNTVEHVLVPSKWLINYWQEQGLRTPIDVYPHGINPDDYPYAERPDRDTFTFIQYGQLGIRKGTDIVVKAFKEEFKGKKDVFLVLKDTNPVLPFPANIPQVIEIHATFDRQKMRELLYFSDCMIFPTRGEGFGLTPFEAMATGLPAIVTGWSGPTDYVDKEDTLILDYDMKKAKEFDLIYQDELEEGEDTGLWAEPKLEDVMAKMRWAYEHRKEAKAMGKKASERIHRDWTWEKQVDKLIQIINRAA